MPLLGHLWTLAPNIRHQLRPILAPPGSPWSTELQDPDHGTIPLNGVLHPTQQPSGDPPSLVIAVHGLGGSIDSHYILRTAATATAAGFDCLRLALRGADRQGADFYHAGLTADLQAALASPLLAAYRTIYLLGYSLGGHVSLHYAVQPSDPRVRAVASVCAPLDLQAVGHAIDHPRAALYCHHVLEGLKDIYTQVAARRSVPTPLTCVRRVTTLRAWDRLAVVPRFRFASVDDYYQRTSIGPRLAEVALPALVLSATGDPMIPASTIAPFVKRVPAHLTHLWVSRGGHVGFPGQLQLGLGPAPGLVPQVLAWFRGHA